MAKLNKHDKVLAKYKKRKSDKLEQAASNMLKKMDNLDKLKEKKIKGKFLDLF